MAPTFRFPSWSQQINNFISAAGRGDLRGVKSFLTQYPYLIDQFTKDNYGPKKTALMAAAENHQAEVVKFLLKHKHGPDVNLYEKDVPTNRVASTALLRAISTDDLEIAQLLLDAGADITIMGDFYTNALNAATISASEKMVEWVLDHGGDIHARMGNNHTALMLAAEYGCIENMRVLLQRGACTNDRDFEGCPPLMWIRKLSTQSTPERRVEMMQMLLDAGANINAVNNHGWSSLMHYVAEGDEVMVQALLKAGANPRIVSNAKETAISLARKTRPAAEGMLMEVFIAKYTRGLNIKEAEEVIRGGLKVPMLLPKPIFKKPKGPSPG